jgi:hypothetical protein
MLDLDSLGGVKLIVPGTKKDTDPDENDFGENDSADNASDSNDSASATSHGAAVSASGGSSSAPLQHQDSASTLDDDQDETEVNSVKILIICTPSFNLFF